MKYIIAFEVEAESLNEADHIAEAIADGNELNIAFVIDNDTLNATLQGGGI